MPNTNTNPTAPPTPTETITQYKARTGRDDFGMYRADGSPLARYAYSIGWETGRVGDASGSGASASGNPFCRHTQWDARRDWCAGRRDGALA